MIKQYWIFGLRNWRYLVVGMTFMLMSGFGQTRFIALFGAGLQTTFSLTDEERGSVYAAATFCSALTLRYTAWEWLVVRKGPSGGYRRL